MTKNNSWNMDDDRVVLTDINQQITGDKEFTGLVEVPTPGTIDEAVNLGYIQNNSWNLVTAFTITTPVQYLTFTDIGSWNTYKFFLNGIIPDTNAVYLALQGSNDNGSTWEENTTQSIGATNNVITAMGTVYGISARLAGPTPNTYWGVSGIIEFPFVTSPTDFSSFCSEITYWDSSSGRQALYKTDGVIQSIGPLNTIRIFFTSGNISAGRVSLYGAM